MVGSRTARALVGLTTSLVVSAAAWDDYDPLLLFLFVPFVPFLFRRGNGDDRATVRRCPACGYATSNLESPSQAARSPRPPCPDSERYP